MKIKKFITFILLFCLFTYSINIFATSSDVDEENDQTSVSENVEEDNEENTNQENEVSENAVSNTSNPETTPTDTTSSRYVTSVKPATTNYEANLGLNNILCIFLITIGILLIILNIAILIKIK